MSGPRLGALSDNRWSEGIFLRNLTAEEITVVRVSGFLRLFEAWSLPLSPSMVLRCATSCSKNSELSENRGLRGRYLRRFCNVKLVVRNAGMCMCQGSSHPSTVWPSPSMLNGDKSVVVPFRVCLFAAVVEADDLREQVNINITIPTSSFKINSGP
jgi:hypothetical protein